MEVDMKIKRYTAVSMRAALAQVRAEQGPDAVILSSRRNEEGIEVIAAIDYDEALFMAANRQRAPEPAIPSPPVSETAVVAPAAATVAAVRSAPAVATVAVARSAPAIAGASAAKRVPSVIGTPAPTPA